MRDDNQFDPTAYGFKEQAKVHSCSRCRIWRRGAWGIGWNPGTDFMAVSHRRRVIHEGRWPGDAASGEDALRRLGILKEDQP